MFASIRSQQVFLNRKILGQLIVWLRIRQLLVARKMDNYIPAEVLLHESEPRWFVSM